MKFIRNKPVWELSDDEITDNFLSSEIKNKSRILSYMKSFSEPSAYTSQPVIDRFTNQELNKINNAFSDGIYTWYADEIYHVEKYNLKLNDDFIEYVLNKVR
ncbi:MAG: hypothetical protein UD936_06560 [Acutalibacteraceae bacterium]|nr:hypothetical protein [Acutalibacteraceae bacterium]